MATPRLVRDLRGRAHRPPRAQCRADPGRPPAPTDRYRYAAWNALEDLARDEEQAQWRLEKLKACHPTEGHHVMARVAHFQELERRYIPGADERLGAPAGFGEGSSAR